MLIKFDAPKTGKWALYFDGCIVNDGVRIVDMRNDDNNMAYVCTRRVPRGEYGRPLKNAILLLLKALPEEMIMNRYYRR